MGNARNRFSGTLVNTFWNQTISKEVKAIIVGVVGFWVGVFGMGLVFMLVVYLRRILRRVQNQPINDSMLINKVSND